MQVANSFEDPQSMGIIPHDLSVMTDWRENPMPFSETGFHLARDVPPYQAHRSAPQADLSFDAGVAWSSLPQEIESWDEMTLQTTFPVPFSSGFGTQWPEEQSSEDGSYHHAISTPLDPGQSPNTSISGLHDATGERYGYEETYTGPYFGDGVHMDDIHACNGDPCLDQLSGLPCSTPPSPEHNNPDEELTGLSITVNHANRSSMDQDDRAVTHSPSDSGSDYTPASRRKSKPTGMTNSGKGSRSQRTQPLSSIKAKSRGSGVSKRAAPRKSIPASAKKYSNSASSPKFVCEVCDEALASENLLQKHITVTHTRPFGCTFGLYGCKSNFGSKNEWKRHVTSQHLRLGIWRCDLRGCQGKSASPPASSASSYPCSPGRSDTASVIHVRSASDVEEVEELVFNDFNRKDLFTQHLKRMHVAEVPTTNNEALDKQNWAQWVRETSERCWLVIREPPSRSVCGFCVSAGRPHEPFEGANAWELRMEHVGKHLEAGVDASAWVEDLELRTWLLQEGLLQHNARGTFELSVSGGLKEYRGR